MVSLVRCDSKDAFKTNFAPVLRELWRFRVRSGFTRYWANLQNERAFTASRGLLSFQIHQRIEGYCSIERATALLSFSSFREYQVHFSSTLFKYIFQVHLGGISMWCVSMGSPLPMNFFLAENIFFGAFAPQANPNRFHFSRLCGRNKNTRHVAAPKAPEPCARPSLVRWCCVCAILVLTGTGERVAESLERRRTRRQDSPLPPPSPT